jgi:hypothetical protein
MKGEWAYPKINLGKVEEREGVEGWETEEARC